MKPHLKRHRRACLFAVASGALYLMAPAPGLAAQPAPGTVTRTDGFLVNYFFQKYGDVNGADLNTQVVADSQNHLLFEINAYDPPSGSNACDRIEAFNADTFAHLANEPPNCDTLISWSNASGSHSKMPAVAVDSTDQLLIVVDPTLNELIALSEQSLARVAAWPLPAAQGPGGVPAIGAIKVVGMSWSASGDQLLLLIDEPSMTLNVVDYAITDALNGSTQARWSLQVPGCQSGVPPYYGESAAFLSADNSALFIPCQLNGSGYDQHSAVVRIALSQGVSCVPGGSFCPVRDGSTGQPQAQTALSPRPLNDAFFDPASNRLLFPLNGGVDVEVVTYDGNLNPPAFTGAMSTGSVNDASFAFEPSVGRLYAISDTQLTLLDVRRTPFQPGSKFEQPYVGSVNYESLPALTPDSAHPYRRFLAAYADVHDNAALRGFTTFSDEAPLTTDPPPDSIDRNTYGGAVRPGSTILSSFGAAASGYGVHSDLVGGTAELANETRQGGLDTSQDPFIGGTRDVLMGWVQQNRVANGTTDDAAVAVGAADGSSPHDLATCTEVAVPPYCGPPMALPVSTPTPGPSQSPLPTPPPTSQQWPWPTAECSQPGPSKPSVTWSGTYSTSYDSKGSPQQQMLPNVQGGGATATDDTASVDCAAVSPEAGSSLAWAEARTLYAGGPSAGPSVTVGNAYSTTTVQPASTDVGPAVQVTSLAQGIHIDLGAPPAGVDWPAHATAIDIGSIQQVATATAGGRPNTAHATDHVTVSDVVVDSEHGVADQLCASKCPPDVIDTLNADFPSLLHIMQPSPDDTFGAKDRDGNLPGSPGGYQAVVQADILEQQGDHQFNDMDPSEAVMLPAMRVVLYQDGGASTGYSQINREVLDLAGVFAEAHEGISVFDSVPPPPQTPTNVILEQQAAGVTNTTIVNPPAVINVPPGPNNNGPGGVVGVVEQVMTGLNYLIRSPLATLRMFMVLMVLGLPLFLIIRRRAWLAER